MNLKNIYYWVQNPKHIFLFPHDMYVARMLDTSCRSLDKLQKYSWVCLVLDLFSVALFLQYRQFSKLHVSWRSVQNVTKTNMTYDIAFCILFRRVSIVLCQQSVSFLQMLQYVKYKTQQVGSVKANCCCSSMHICWESNFTRCMLKYRCHADVCTWR